MRILLLLLALSVGFQFGYTQNNADRIQPYAENPRFWQYKGQPVMLIGGSKDDNLFQISDLKAHLDLMQSVGGNYIRNTMSGRDEGNVWPFVESDGQYNLDEWNEEYWQRFSNLLQWTAERDIIVQIEVWAFHDFQGQKWEHNPWNPVKNFSYELENTQLQAESYGDYWTAQHDFFYTVPKLNNDEKVLAYQQAFVDKMLSYSLEYDHVLYAMTNEIFTQYSPEWGWYWADYIKQRAEEEGVEVAVSEMYQNHDLDHEQHKASFDHPEIYDFVDISQNSRKLNQEHWDKLQFVRNYLSDHPRPINHTKTYGGMRGQWTDGPNHGIERFWRNIIGGAASVRFHRPPSGIGLNERAQAHIKSARLLLEEINIFKSEPDVNSSLLQERHPDEAYLTSIPGESYALYFPDGGDIQLDLSDAEGNFEIRWLNIEGSNWQSESTVQGGKSIRLKTPGNGGNWAAVVKRQ